MVIADASACSHPQQQSTQPANLPSRQPTSVPSLAPPVPVIENASRPTTRPSYATRSCGGSTSPRNTTTSQPRIADGAAAQATVVGSGRVGRTKTLSVDDRAALAARAYIRHHHTDYHDRLDNANVGLGDDIDDDDYREIKRAAHDEVEAFLDAHRRHQPGGGATV